MNHIAVILAAVLKSDLCGETLTDTRGVITGTGSLGLGIPGRNVGSLPVLTPTNLPMQH